MEKIFAKLRESSRGIAAVEFGLVATPFFILLMGGFDLSHTLYMQSQLQGTVQKASRDSTLATGTETEQQALIDAKVRSAVRDLNTSLSDNDIKISRTFYSNFANAQNARPEDANQDGICSPGEVWIDRNFDNVYSAKGGSQGQGSAKDIVTYSVTVTYPRMFPVANLIGMSPNVELNATTVLANQPYGDQASRTGSLAPRNCP